MGAWRWHPLDGDAGQASVEAALLLPAVLVLVGLLVEPVCLLYTQAVMAQAAAECARALATGDAPDDSCRAFVLRRLAAVPEAAPFHVGGEADWEIDLDGGGTGGAVRVAIAGHARPLPLAAAMAGALVGADDAGVRLSVEASERLRANWVKGSYGEWIGMWK